MTYTTFIQRSNKAGADNFTKKPLFQTLNEWFRDYLTDPDYDWIKDKKQQPAAGWGKLYPNAEGRAEPNIEYLHSYFVLDYDECLLDPAAFVNELARSGLHCFFHETTGSQKEKDELQQTIYKYHVFIETNSILDKGVFINHGKEILAKVGSRVGIAGYDEACHDAPRIMFLPVRSLLRKDEQGEYIPLAYGEMLGDKLDILTIVDEVLQEADEKRKAAEQEAVSPPFEAPETQETSNGYTTPTNHTSGAVGFKMRDCTPEVRSRVVDMLLSGVPFTDNTQWMSVAFAIFDAVGESGKQNWEHWCKHTISYDPAKHDKQIASAWKSATKTDSYDNNIAPLMAVCTDMGKKSQAATMIYYNDVNATKTQAHRPSTHEDTMSLDNTPNIEKMIAWDSMETETHKSVAPETERGMKTGIPAIDNNIGVWACTQARPGNKGVDALGVLSTSSSLLVGGATGVGKTTAMCNLILSYANKNNNPLGEAKNVIVFSLEGGASMYTETLLRISQHKRFTEDRVKDRLDDFYNRHGRSVLYPKNEEDLDRFHDKGSVSEYQDTGFKNQYNTDCMRELTDILITSNPDLGRITITNSFQSMYPKEIIDQIEIIEQVLGITYDIIVVDYVQALLFDTTKAGSEIQGIMASTKTLIDWCNKNQRLPVFATQLVNYNAPEHEKPLYLNDIALSKNISTMFSHVLLLQQAQYDREYSTKDSSVDARVGALRVNIAKSRTGGKTRTNTECLIGVCQDTLAFTTDEINPEIVKKSDVEQKEKIEAERKRIKKEIATEGNTQAQDKPTTNKTQTGRYSNGQ